MGIRSLTWTSSRTGRWCSRSPGRARRAASNTDSEATGCTNIGAEAPQTQAARNPRQKSSDVSSRSDPIPLLTGSDPIQEANPQPGTLMAASTVEASLGFGSVPLLVYFYGRHPDLRLTTFSPADQSLRTGVVPELTENNSHVTPQGWVFLHEPDTRRARLWDPRSGDTVALPPTDDDLPESRKCCISAAPTAAAPCVVVILHLAEPRLLYCRVGDSRWTAHGYDIGCVDLPYPPPKRRVIREAAAMGGKFYFLEMGKLGAIDFSSSSPEPALSFLDYPLIGFPDASSCALPYLVVSRGELFMVNIYFKDVTPEVLTMRVHRFGDLSGPTATLTELHDLGDRAFLLSDSNEQLLCSASKYGIKGNRVYAMLNVLSEPNGGFMCIYDMDDQSVETVQPCQDMKDLMSDPFWVLPTDSV
ncbi:hypothetical protein ACP4OV_030112 [Aristida adscensionis]